MFGKSIKDDSNYREAILILGLLMILIIRDIIGININKFLITGFVATIMINASIPSIISMLSFCFPLFCGLPGKYIIVIAFALILWKGHFKLNIYQIMCLFFIIIMEVLASIWYMKNDWLETIGYMLFAIVMFWMLWTEEDLDHKQCLKMFLLGDAILCGIIIIAGIKTAPSNWIDLFSTGKFRFGSTQVEEIGNGMTLWLNPNGLAYFSIVGISIALVLIENNKKKITIHYIIMIAICTIAGYLTQSRSWLICLFILFAIYMIGKLTSMKAFISFSIALTIIVCLLIYYFGNHPEFLSGLETRMTDSDIASGDGRTYLFQKYMEVFFDNLRFQLIGTGVMEVRTVTGITRNGLHNSTQQLLICYGIPGFLFIIYHLFAPVHRIAKGNKLNIIYWLPLLSVILFTQTIQFVYPYVYMPPFAISAYALVLGRNEKELEASYIGQKE